MCSAAATHLLRVHFKLPNNLDGNLSGLSGGIYRSVDIAKGTVAHLLDELPSLQAWISWQLSFALVFLGNHSCKLLVVDLLSLGATSDLLVVSGSMGGNIASLRSSVLSHIGSREGVAVRLLVCLMIHDVGFTVCVIVVRGCSIVVVLGWLLLSVDGRNVSRCVTLIIGSRLLS